MRLARVALVLMITVGVAGFPASAHAAAASNDCHPYSCWTLTPSSGPAGTVVHFRGRLRADEARVVTDPGVYGLMYGNYPKSATMPDGCNGGFTLDTRNWRFHVLRARRVITGTVTVLGTGQCEPPHVGTIPARDVGERVAPPGPFAFVVGCMACVWATFTLTGAPSSLAMTGSPEAMPMLVTGVVLMLAGAAATALGRRRTD